MKIDKAIELLTIELSAFPHKGTEDWYDSVKLGIEALRRYKILRANFGKLKGDQLEGETE